MRLPAISLFVIASCGGPSTRDYRDDRVALARVLAADAATAERLDPLVTALGAERDFTAAAARARREAEVRESAARAERLARAVRAKTPEGKALGEELVEAMGERRELVRAIAAAAASGDAQAALEAIRAARALEERLVDVDERVEALAP